MAIGHSADARWVHNLVMTALSAGDAAAVIEHTDWLRSIGRSPDTVEDRVRLLTRLGAWLAAREDPKELVTATADDLAAWQRSISRMALESISTYVGHAKGFYAWWAKFHHAPNAGELLVRPSLPRRLPRPISDESLREALRLADGQMQVILLLMAFLGLRCGEVSRLVRNDLREFEDPPIAVIHGKGGKHRVVRAPNDLIPQLRMIGIPQRGHIVLSVNGGPLTPNRVSQMTNAYLHSIGISDTAHSLRHWYGTHVYRVTRDVRLVQEMMGHANLSTTAMYTAFAPSRADDMAADLDSTIQAMLGRPRLRAVDGGP